jgi:hypothetical protein
LVQQTQQLSKLIQINIFSTVQDVEEFEECDEVTIDVPQKAAPRKSAPSVFAPIDYDALAKEFDVPVKAQASVFNAPAASTPSSPSKVRARAAMKSHGAQEAKPQVKAAPAKSAPAKASPAKAAPAKASPAKASPAKASPVQAAPVQTAPAASAPVQAHAPSTGSTEKCRTNPRSYRVEPQEAEVNHHNSGYYAHNEPVTEVTRESAPVVQQQPEVVPQSNPNWISPSVQEVETRPSQNWISPVTKQGEDFGPQSNSNWISPTNIGPSTPTDSKVTYYNQDTIDPVAYNPTSSTSYNKPGQTSDEKLQFYDEY